MSNIGFVWRKHDEQDDGPSRKLQQYPCGNRRAAQCRKGAASRNVNTLMTTTYWKIGRRIVQSEQAGDKRAGYGDVLIHKKSPEKLQAAKTVEMRSFLHDKSAYGLSPVTRWNGRLSESTALRVDAPSWCYRSGDCSA
jgi:hypothetical protein